jgi:hypothetical protein
MEAGGCVARVGKERQQNLLLLLRQRLAALSGRHGQQRT